ncbi:Protein CBG07861 [Caenorhabditis briggsae]|uniref:Protein CBG07861 n=2 Tax=Caenorhabditis briggsae TaxID=6238 RepID=A8X5A6_CAEBR|nr:Protein CBG07861 [Caenorhabditis briggsae]ULU08254.1 hypothetical protein L3Y34_019416 [Caenorhabditis briggsae]CAP27805.1 Protein CBG07861 [Caenorhabditis briggsae]
MNTLTIVLLLSLTVAMVHSTFNSEKSAMEKADNQGNFFAEMFSDIQGSPNAKKSRSRRLSCGFKLLQKIAGYCGELTSETGVDIASICCRSECSEEFIKRSVCPEML